MAIESRVFFQVPNELKTVLTLANPSIVHMLFSANDKLQTMQQCSQVKKMEVNNETSTTLEEAEKVLLPHSIPIPSSSTKWDSSVLATSQMILKSSSEERTDQYVVLPAPMSNYIGIKARGGGGYGVFSSGKEKIEIKFAEPLQQQSGATSGKVAKNAAAPFSTDIAHWGKYQSKIEKGLGNIPAMIDFVNEVKLHCSNSMVASQLSDVVKFFTSFQKKNVPLEDEAKKNPSLNIPTIALQKSRRTSAYQSVVALEETDITIPGLDGVLIRSWCAEGWGGDDRPLLLQVNGRWKDVVHAHFQQHIYQQQLVAEKQSIEVVVNTTSASGPKSSSKSPLGTTSPLFLTSSGYGEFVQKFVESFGSSKY